MSCLPYMYISMFTGATVGADHIQMSGGCTWCLLMSRCHGEYWHSSLSRVTQCHVSQPLMQQQRRKCWEIWIKNVRTILTRRSEEVRTRGLIKDGTIYGEVFVWEIVWSMECGEERHEVRRDTEGLWHKEGVRNVPHHDQMSVIPWCQHQRPGASRSLQASCSACAAVSFCSSEPFTAVSHGPAGRAAHTNTGLKPSSGNEINYSKLLLSLNFRVQLAILKQKLDTEELYT